MVMAERRTGGIAWAVALVRTGPDAWVIEDANYAAADARRQLARVREEDTDVVVEWRHDVPLAARYVSAEAALEDVKWWLEHPPRGTRPIPIPHFPPHPAT